MTDEEFDQWFSFHRKLFPAAWAWMLTIEDHGVSLRVEWAEILRGVSLEDAKRASRAMLAGDEARAENYEHNMTAARIRQAVKSFARSRSQPSESERPHERKIVNFPAGRLFTEMQRRISQGESPSEAAKAVVDSWERDNPSDEQNGPRFSCVKCLDNDSGLVEVVDAYTASAMQKIIDGAPIKTASCSCDCKGARKKNEQRQLPTYDVSFHVWRNPRSSPEKIREKLAEFIADKLSEKRHSAFDKFNQPEFV